MHAWILVAVGSALGGLARYGMSQAIAARWGETFPWGTLVINLAGSFLIGVLAGWTGATGKPVLEANGRLFLITGVLGGYTTFSAFSLQTLELIQQGRVGAALAYVLASVLGGLGAVALGYVVARMAS